MRSNEERIALLHERAKRIRREQNRNYLIASGSVSALLLAMLVMVVAQFENGAIKEAGSIYAASSLLSENTGGYVLAGVLAFMAGVVITVILRRQIEKKTKEKEEKSFIDF